MAWVVPYCPQLLLLWQGHINTKSIFTSNVFLYIYKYVFKGVDHTKFSITPANQIKDAIDDYVQGQWLSAPEAAYQIFSFDIACQIPSVTCLKFHAPSQNHPQYCHLSNTTSHASS